LAGSSPDQLALERSEPVTHGKHQAAMRRGGIGPDIRQPAEEGSSFRDRCQDTQEVTCGAGEPIEPRDQKHIARFKSLDRRGEDAPICTRAAHPETDAQVNLYIAEAVKDRLAEQAMAKTYGMNRER